MKPKRYARKIASTALTASFLLSAMPANAIEVGAQDCNPQYYEAMQQAAVRGSHRQVAVIRNNKTGIRQPESLMDFSCLDKLFNMPNINILFDPTSILDGILGAIQKEVCERVTQAYAENIGRPLDKLIYSRKLPKLPGLDVTTGSGGSSSIRVEPLRRPKADPNNHEIIDIFKRAIGG